ncbi:hypothetical protein ACFQJ8_13045 [Halocatena marina]|uniref:hypothetical protein n=1 Tax=Halocatena marina TaxID=2934937 RepID=UPI0036081DC7
MSHTNDDGSKPEDGPFGTTSSYSTTRSDRTRQALDEFVLTPFSIIWSDVRARLGFLIIVCYLLQEPSVWRWSTARSRMRRNGCWLHSNCCSILSVPTPSVAGYSHNQFTRHRPCCKSCYRVDSGSSPSARPSE